MEEVSSTCPLIDWDIITPAPYRERTDTGRHRLCWFSISFFLLSRRIRMHNVKERWDITTGEELQRALIQASRTTAKSFNKRHSQGNLTVSDNFFTLTTDPLALFMDLISAIGHKDERHEQCAVPCEVLLATRVERTYGGQFSANVIPKEDSCPLPNDYSPFTQVHSKILPQPGPPEPEDSFRSHACSDPQQSSQKAGHPICPKSNGMTQTPSTYRYGSLFKHANRELLPPRTWSELLPSNTNDPNWGPDLSEVAPGRKPATNPP